MEAHRIQVLLRLRSLAGPLAGLGGEEDVLPEGGNDGSVHVFGISIRVAARHVEVVDAEVHRPAEVGQGWLGPFGLPAQFRAEVVAAQSPIRIGMS
jgi:hypothetical protein